MTQNKGTYKLLEPVIEAMFKTVKVDSITADGGNFVITSCNTLWLGPAGKKITVDGEEWEIISIAPNLSVTLKHSDPDEEFTAKQFDIELPEFRHGTPLQTNQEVTNDKRKAWQKYPMIWLQEVTDERFYPDPSDFVERVSSCVIHFLTETNFKDWTVDQAESLSVQAARNMQAEFVKALHKPGVTAETEPGDTYLIQARVNWGQYQNDKGHIKNIFPDNLSGVTHSEDIQFLKSYACKC